MGSYASFVLRDIVFEARRYMSMLSLVSEFHQYKISNGSSERHQNNNLKAIVCFARFLGPTISFLDICKKEQVLPFLDTKIKNSEEDPEKETLKAFSMDEADKIIEKLA
jgi:hypothetical protein